MRDLRDAQALEKKRLQAEQHTAQSAQIQLSAPRATSANSSSSSVTQNEPIANKSMRKGKHARKPNSPYFTAVDPKAKPKKKSTAKTVPASSVSNP
jgi:hypothetical protein